MTTSSSPATAPDAAFGDSGNDWEEGGDRPDLLQGDSGNLFFLDDSRQPGHDILIGQGGDDDYDMEGGDDIGVGGPGIEKNAGGSGYDWSIGSTADRRRRPAVTRTSHSRSRRSDILTVGVRDRYNEVEALSGSTSTTRCAATTSSRPRRRRRLHRL